MMAVNLQNNRLLLLTAYQQVIDEATDTDWALYTYEGDGNDLTISSSGGGGLAAITVLFDSSMVMYGFCSLKEPNAALPRYILINWVGEDVPDARKCACASHVATIADFFQGVDVIINASSMEDIDPSAIGQRLTNGTTPGGVASPVLSRLKTREDEQGGTVYEKTNAEIEMKKINREEFWEQAKREEELRKEEEKKKLAEERQRFEEERMELERKEQEDREKRYRERERQIEEHRKKMQEEEEAKERQRNQPSIVTELSGDDLNADKKESEVDEAKAIIAQRSGNPREFFKLKERAMTVCVDSSPVSIHRTGRLDSPFLRQQHSPTTSDPSSDHPKTWGGGSSMSPLRTTSRPARTQNPPWAASDGDDTTEVSLDHGRMASMSPIPKIVTTPIKEEQRKDHQEDSTNEWDSGSGWNPEPQESTPPRPVQSVAPQARDPAKFNVWESGTDSLVDIWDSSQNTPSSPKADSPDAKSAAVSGPRMMPLLSFDEAADGSTCSGSGGVGTEDEPSSLVAVAGGGDHMTLSYQQALQHAEGEELEQDAGRTITNGDTLLKDATQAGSEGYFSQSQEEEFGQSEECSAKHTPVFYNKPPEIDITCWDTDPVEDDDD